MNRNYFMLYHEHVMWNLIKLIIILVGDVSKLHQFHQCTVKIKVKMDYVVLLKGGTDKYLEECERILNELLKLKSYNEARLFSEISKVNRQDITIHQV